MKIARSRPRSASSHPSKKISDLFDLRTVPWVRLGTIAVGVAVVAIVLYRLIEIDAIHDYAARIDGRLAFGLLTVLPLLGFPVNVLHLAAGIRFGVSLGMPLVALSILLQLLASYGLVHLFRDRFARRLARWRSRIPEGSHTSICVLAVLLPGAPFAAINYLLPVIGVPLRTYLLCCLPIHVLRSTITVTLGGQSNQLTATRLVVLGAYALSILGASWWMYRRLEGKLGGPPSAAGGRKQPA